MRTVHLYGWLAEKYGDTLNFNVSSISELMKAMKANFKDWESSIRDGEFEVVVGKDLDSNHLSENELFLNFNNNDDFHIAPVIEGRKGWVQVIIGVVLIVVGVVLLYTPLSAAGPYLISAGIGMVIGGVAQLIMGPPNVGSLDYAEREKADERPSFLFKGGVNNVEQGGPVPLVYGQIMCGSTVISASIRNEDIA